MHPINGPSPCLKTPQITMASRISPAETHAHGRIKSKFVKGCQVPDAAAGEMSAGLMRIGQHGHKRTHQSKPNQAVFSDKGARSLSTRFAGNWGSG